LYQCRSTKTCSTSPAILRRRLLDDQLVIVVNEVEPHGGKIEEGCQREEKHRDGERAPRRERRIRRRTKSRGAFFEARRASFRTFAIRGAHPPISIRYEPGALNVLSLSDSTASNCHGR
jgi:hypothetical protein